MSLNIALLNAISGLQTSSRGLDVTAQNVSNVNTEGYSRKVVHQQALVIAGMGAGVDIAEISRAVDNFLVKETRSATSSLNTVQAKDAIYQRMQDLFGTVDSATSPAQGLADLATKFQALSDTPEDVSLRTDMVQRAQLLTQQLNQISIQIDSLRTDIDQQVQDAVSTVNAQLDLVSQLNVQIAEGKAQGISVADLEDQRDIALNKVAEQMNIQHFTKSSGEVVVLTTTGHALVDSGAATIDHTATSSVNPLITLAAGSIDGINLNGSDITSEITDGKIAGLVELRDTILPNLQSQLQELVTTMHDEINAIHNQGTAYPGLSSVTSTRTLAAADTPVWSGNFRVAVTDTSGTVVETQDFDLSTMPTVGDLVTAIDGMANVTAAIDAAGKLVITPTAGDRVSFNEMTSSVTVGSRTDAASQFLGLNDFFTSSADYDNYAGSYQANRTTALGLAGTLTFTGSFGAANVNYLVGNDLDDIAAAINADAGLAAANIQASVVTDGSGYRLRINDSDSDNFFVTDSGTLVSTMAIKPRDLDVVAGIGVRSDIVNDPSLVSRGTLSNAAGLAAGDLALTPGDQSTVKAIANRFNANIQFNATNLLAASSTSLATYATSILSLNSTQAKATSDLLNSRQVLVSNLQANTASVSGVNIDEEMSKLVILQQAYAASARVITTTQQLFDALNQMLG